jgi:hypothetical protein
MISSENDIIEGEGFIDNIYNYLWTKDPYLSVGNIFIFL